MSETVIKKTGPKGASTKIRKKLGLLIPEDPGIRKLVLTLGGAVFVTILNLVVYFAGKYDPIEYYMFDLRTTTVNKLWPHSTEEFPLNEVLVVDITQEAIDSYKDGHPQTVICESQHRGKHFGWPWPRNKYVDLIRRLKNHGAKYIIFDLLFTESLRSDPQYVKEDIELAKCAKELGNVMFVCGSLPDYGRERIPGKFPEQMKRHLIKVTIKDGDVKPISGVWMLHPLKQLAETANSMPDSRVDPDRDGITRSYPLFTEIEGTPEMKAAAGVSNLYLPTVATAIIMRQENTNEIIIENRKAKIGRYSIPIDEHGRFVMNYYRPLKGPDGKKYERGIRTVQYHYLDDIRNDSEMDALVRNKIVLIGSSAPGLMDLKPVPGEKNAPGVEVHATAICNIISKGWIKKVSTDTNLALLGTYVFGLFILFRYMTKNIFSNIARNVIVYVHVAAGFLLFHYKIWIDIAAPGFALLSAYASAMGMNYASERKQRLAVKNAFEKMVDPALVKVLLKKEIKLTGEKRHLTCMFIDIAGFTTISEKMDPALLVLLLKDFFNEIVNEIIANKGTFDKYIGDAVMAFFGYPLETPEHAYNACKTAVNIQKRLKALSERVLAEHGVELKARAGINTGMMVVGPIGSDFRMNCSVLGDEVNLASRLEGAGKAFGCSMLISESTCRLANEQREKSGDIETSTFIKNRVTVREVGLVKVKGKTIPIRIFNLVAVDGEMLDDPIVIRHANAIELMKKGKIEEAAAEFQKIGDEFNDGLAKNLAKRLKTGNFTLHDGEPTFELESK